eukprot:4423878-Amphidinium_carterae.1
MKEVWSWMARQENFLTPASVAACATWIAPSSARCAAWRLRAQSKHCAEAAMRYRKRMSSPP